MNMLVSVVGKFIAWFLSWAVWNPGFVATSASNMWAEAMKGFNGILAIWQDTDDWMMSQISTCGPVKTAGLTLLLWTTIILGVIGVIVIVACELLLGAFLVFYLSPLGVTVVVLAVVMKKKAFLKRVLWAFTETYKEEQQKKRKEKRKKKFRVVGK